MNSPAFKPVRVETGRFLAFNGWSIPVWFQMSDVIPRTNPPPILPEEAANDVVGDPQGNPIEQVGDERLEPHTADARGSFTANREIRYWLEWQSRMISGVIRGGIFLMPDQNKDGTFNEILWPETSVDTSVLRKLAKEAVRTEKPLVRGNVPDGSGIVDVVACPIMLDQQPLGAVVFTLTNRTENQRNSVQQLMQWCVVWLGNLLKSQIRAGKSTAETQLQAVNLLSEVAPLAVSSYQLCSYLADEFDCSLVALGLRQEMTVQTLAVSNQMDFDRRTQRISELEFAMEECADQDTTIFLSPENSDMTVITQAHSHLLKENAELVVCSVPVRDQESLIGVLTFIKTQNASFSSEQRQKIDGLITAIGPVLQLQTIARQSLLQKLQQSCTENYKKLVGRDNVKLKTMTGLLLLISLLLVTVPAEQRVTATASLEGSMHQAIVAPNDGYIKSVHARAGDTVIAGQPLVALDDSSLSLQVDKWSSERDKLSSEYQLAWANRDKAQVSIIAARLAQSEAQLALVESEIDHSEITAPFDGLLISGDLSRLTGTPVEQGQLLYELVPLTGFKVILSINEYDVGKLKSEQRGVLRLTSNPDKPIDFTIQNVFPIASVRQNQNVFRVEAFLQNPPENLRPGMQGIGKITVGESTIGSVWTQSFRERLKLRAWYFGF